MTGFSGIFVNRVLWVPALTGILTQLFKFFLYYLRDGRPDVRWLIRTGGMPSSHSATVMALSTMVGLKEGFSSAIFGVTLIMSFIIMYDAAGVRRAAGKQAEVINRMIDELQIEHRIRDERLRELLGHTPLEVFVGAFMGVAIALLIGV